jgi:hypothetical protein
MKAREIYGNLTETERTEYVALRKAQGQRMAEAMLPVLLLSVLFVSLGRFDWHAILLFSVLCGVCAFRGLQQIRSMRRHNREWLACTVFAQSKGVTFEDIEL